MSHEDPLESADALEKRRREERRPVEEAGGGVAEGFELAEQELIDHASHTDEQTTAPIERGAGEVEPEDSGVVYGEPDEEHRPD